MAYEIDGIDVRGDGASFALSMSDLPFIPMEERIALLSRLAESCWHLRFVCVRNDSSDPVVFTEAVTVAAASGLGLILESRDPACLAAALSAVPDRRPLLLITDPYRTTETSVLSGISGCPVAVTGGDVQSLMDNVEMAEGHGASSVVLAPDTPNMKSCLETNTDIHRLADEHAVRQASYPLMTRTWSGEYALAVASVSVMRYGDIVVLDDLDPEGCLVLDALMDSVQQSGPQDGN